MFLCQLFKIHSIRMMGTFCLGQWRTEGGGVGEVQTPPPRPKFRRPSKIVPNSTRLWKLLIIAEFRTQAPQDVRKKGSKIPKLPLVRNCFILAMTNKLVVIINSLKVPKINKILPYEMKFLVPNYSCLQNPWLGGYRPPDPRSVCPLSSTEFVEPSTPNKITGYALGLGAPFVVYMGCFFSLLSRSVVLLWLFLRGDG